MAKRVAELQNSFQSIVNTLRKNKMVLAIFTFGSIVSGDVWDESNIDLFVVYDNEFENLRDVYSEVLGVPVHTKILHKKTFIELVECDGKKAFVKNLLTSSRLVFSRDDEIMQVYNKARYSNNNISNRWNLVYLGKLLKDLGICKKYLQIGGLSTSYEVLIRTLDSYSRLYLNLNGYAVTKDSLTMAINLNNSFNEVMDKLFNEKLSKESISSTINYIERYIDENIVIASQVILDYLFQKKNKVSSYEIMREEEFKDFEIKIEYILKDLTKRKLIVKDKRIFEDSLGNRILDENVYSAKGMAK